MTIMTVHVPALQEGWFEQMLRSMGWRFRKEECLDEKMTDNENFEDSNRARQLEDLLEAVRTKEVADITDQEIIDECKAVRKEMYEARNQAN